MKPLVTVPYEDSKVGMAIPLHGLILRKLEDEVNGPTWKLLQLVEEGRRNGIDNVLRALRAASLTAGAGSQFVLVDAAKVSMAALRACIRRHQPGLDALAPALAEIVPNGATA